MAIYDEAIFGVVTRQWFGLTQKYGGSGTIITLSGSATTSDKITRWQPKGPIKILRFGCKVLGTLSSPATADSDWLPFRLLKTNSSGTASVVMGTAHLVAQASGRTALYEIASVSGSSLASQEVEDGRFLKIRTASATTANGTSNIGTILGSVAFFVDWVRQFSDNWNTSGEYS